MMVHQLTSNNDGNVNLSSSSLLEESLCVRFTLVRHAETEANHKGIVLGQTDSTLTPLGIQQAKAYYEKFGKDVFFKIASSDLMRCQITAGLMLGQDEKESSITIDSRLRERAKGVREGQSKNITNEEAMEIFKRQNTTTVLPKLENENEVYCRVLDWMDDLMLECYDDLMLKGCKSSNNGVYDILAITHSGTLRILIENLVSKNLPTNVKEDGRLIVPNTSRTIIELKLLKGEGESDNVFKSKRFDLLWQANLNTLTDVSHFEQLITENVLVDNII